MVEISDIELLELDDDALDLLIGTAVLAHELQSKEPSEHDRRSAGRVWFEHNLDQFRKVICTSTVIRRIMFSPDASDRDTLFAAVIDTVAVLRGLQAPVAVVAARLTHYGLDRLCPNVAPPRREPGGLDG